MLLPDPRLKRLHVASVSLRHFYKFCRQECYSKSGTRYYPMSNTAQEHFDVVMRNRGMFYDTPARQACLGCQAAQQHAAVGFLSISGSSERILERRGGVTKFWVALS